MKVEAPRDTDLCGAWWCRAEKLQQQPQHWQSLHPRRGHTAPATPRVTRVTRVPALTCCVAHAMLHPGLLGLYCRHQLVSPAACPPLALLRRHGRDTPKVACREHQRYTYTHTAHITCHTVTLVLVLHHTDDCHIHCDTPLAAGALLFRSYSLYLVARTSLITVITMV